MKNTQAKQIKWDLVDHLLCNFADNTNFTFGDYSGEEREYALAQIRRIAGVLGVKNHIYL
jgi:hypothetical protein